MERNKVSLTRKLVSATWNSKIHRLVIFHLPKAIILPNLTNVLNIPAPTPTLVLSQRLLGWVGKYTFSWDSLTHDNDSLTNSCFILFIWELLGKGFIFYLCIFVCMCARALTHPHGGRIIGGLPGVTGSCLLPYKDAHQTWALWERSTLNHGAISPALSQPFKTDLMTS